MNEPIHYITVLTRKNMDLIQRLDWMFVGKSSVPRPKQFTYYQGAINYAEGKQDFTFWHCDHKHRSRTSAERCARTEFAYRQRNGWSGL